jgi:hypothetical protein
MSGGGSDQLAKYAGAVAEILLGEPNRRLSTKEELRYGGKGSVSVDLAKGTVFDHSLNEGGGVLWLIEKQTGRKGREAVDWLREHGFEVDDRGGGSRSAGSNRSYGPQDDHGSQGGRSDGPPFKITKTWDYFDEAGTLLFQVLRMENGLIGKDGKPEKTYRQRRPDPSKPDGWNWSTKGVKQVPYRLSDVIEARANGWVIYITEGEKAADRLADLGLPATTNARGAGKWPEELNDYFKGARVVVLADDDPQATTPEGEPKFHDDCRPVFVGIDHANNVAASLLGVAKDVRVVQLTNRQKKEDAFDWIEQGGTAEQLAEIATKAPRYEREPYRSRFNAVTWADMDKPGAEHEWLIKGVLTRAEVAMCAGPSKSGKSFMVIDAGLAVARGVEWFGLRVKQGGVIYQAGEGQKGLKKRIRAYREANELSPDDPLDFVLLPARIDLYHSDDHTEALIEECRYWAGTFTAPLELIVIDTWATATPGANENDGKDVGVVLERCYRLSKATGATVLLVHHMNADGSKVRGHTSILGNLENVLIVRQVEGTTDEYGRQVREVVVDKNKDGEDGKRFRFTLRSIPIGIDKDGDPVTSCIVINTEGTTTDQPPPERPNVTSAEATLVRAIERAEAYSDHEHPTGLGIPAHIKIVRWRDVIKEYDALALEDEPEEEDPEERKKRKDARAKRLQRLGENLLKKNIIGRENPFVWLTGRRIKGYRSGKNAGGSDMPHSEKTTNSDGSGEGYGSYAPHPFDDELWGES